MLVIDANVAVKLAVSEPDSHLADPLLDQALVAPDLIYPEIANILWKKFRLGEIGRATAAEAMATLLDVGIRPVPTAELLPLALDLAIGLDHPAYDLFYVALARRQGIRFVTADRRLVARVRSLRPVPDWAGLVVPLDEA